MEVEQGKDLGSNGIIRSMNVQCTKSFGTTPNDELRSLDALRKVGLCREK